MFSKMREETEVAYVELERLKNLLIDIINNNYRESTAKGYISCLNAVCRDLRARYDFLNLRHSDIIELISHWQESLRNATINNRLTQLKKLFELAVRDGLCSKNPCEGIKSLKRDELLEKNPFEEEELVKMVNTPTLQPSAKRLMRFNCQVGLRIEEGVVLCWSDVDWENRTITVNRARAITRCYLPKTKNSLRTIELNDEAMAILEEQFKVTGNGPKHTLVMKDKSPNSAKATTIQPIFIDDLTGEMFKNSKDYAQRFFTAFLQDAGVAHRGPSQLRHTFASHKLSAGVPIALISKVMGHADIATTQRHYAKWLPKSKDNTIEMLNKGFSSLKANAQENSCKESDQSTLTRRLSLRCEKLARTIKTGLTKPFTAKKKKPGTESSSEYSRPS